MTGFFSNIFLSSSSRKILTYYGSYCLLFLFCYLSIVSTISFFHFLLDHEMAVIENWLQNNTWEALTMAKLIASIMAVKAIKLNNYLTKDAKTLLMEAKYLPSQRGFALSIFLPLFFVVLAKQFAGEFSTNVLSSFEITGFVGSILFFLIDAFVIYFCVNNFKLLKKRQVFFVCCFVPVFFFVVTNIALPYMGKTTLYLVLHFAALMALMYREKRNLGNVLLYSLLVIAPLATIFGADLVWSDARSIYKYPSSAPWFGVVLIWLTGFLYYLRRKRPA